MRHLLNIVTLPNQKKNLSCPRSLIQKVLSKDVFNISNDEIDVPTRMISSTYLRRNVKEPSLSLMNRVCPTCPCGKPLETMKFVSFSNHYRHACLSTWSEASKLCILELAY